MIKHTKSYGILLYRINEARKRPEVFLIEPNLPFLKTKIWGIPKGRMEDGERPLGTAMREFKEETGVPAPEIQYDILGETTTRSGKKITIYSGNASGYEIVWNKADVALAEYEVDGHIRIMKETLSGRWFTLDEAQRRMGIGQRVFIEVLTKHLAKKQILMNS